MLKDRIQILEIFLEILVILSIYSASSVTTTNATSTTISLVNPGPDGYPAKWTASINPRNLDTSDFVFYSNETSVESTFFINVTVRNVECLRGWGVGIVFDKKVLAYISAWLPSDHVFASVEAMGWTIVSPTPTLDSVNETHSIIKWGCAYLMGEPEWSFNGTGTLCQIRFKILKETSAETFIGWNQEWTTLYYHPSGQEVPPTQTAHFKYFGKIPSETEPLLLLTVVTVIIIVVIGTAVMIYYLKVKRKKKRCKN